jgi:hypothetical protein
MEKELLKKVPVGSTFMHYKGKKYKILSIGRHSENEKLHVVYQGLYTCETYGENPIWIRPLEMFLETVVINGKTIPRFSRCE